MAREYYYRNSEEDEVIINTNTFAKSIGLRVSEGDGETALVNLPLEEIDNLIASLQKAKLKITMHNGPSVLNSLNDEDLLFVMTPDGDEIVGEK